MSVDDPVQRHDSECSCCCRRARERQRAAGGSSRWNSKPCKNIRHGLGKANVRSNWTFTVMAFYSAHFIGAVTMYTAFRLRWRLSASLSGHGDAGQTRLPAGQIRLPAGQTRLPCRPRSLLRLRRRHLPQSDGEMQHILLKMTHRA
eukprot:1850215-Rhodomonas_salina.1